MTTKKAQSRIGGDDVSIAVMTKKLYQQLTESCFKFLKACSDDEDHEDGEGCIPSVNITLMLL